MRPRLALHFASRGCQEAPWILVLCAPVWVRGSAAIPCPFWGAYCGLHWSHYGEREGWPERLTLTLDASLARHPR